MWMDQSQLRQFMPTEPRILYSAYHSVTKGWCALPEQQTLERSLRWAWRLFRGLLIFPLRECPHGLAKKWNLVTEISAT